MRLAIVFIILAWWCRVAHAQTLTTTSFIGSTGSTNVSNSAVNYFALSGVDGVSTAYVGSGTDTFISNSTALSWTFRNLYCFLGTSPGVGKSYTITIGIAGVTTFANTVTISDSATSGSDLVNTQSTAAAGTSEMAYRVTPTGTPTATTVGCYIEASIN